MSTYILVYQGTLTEISVISVVGPYDWPLTISETLAFVSKEVTKM